MFSLQHRTGTGPVFANGCLIHRTAPWTLDDCKATNSVTNIVCQCSWPKAPCIPSPTSRELARVLSFRRGQRDSKKSCSVQQCIRSGSHQQWLAWFTVGNRLSNGAVLKYFEAVDMATLSRRCCSWFKQVVRSLRIAFRGSGFRTAHPRYVREPVVQPPGMQQPLSGSAPRDTLLGVIE